jgi:hypothetical protein
MLPADLLGPLEAEVLGDMHRHDVTTRPGGPLSPPALARAVGRVTDVRVEDPQALEEIELYGELVIAASSYDGPLPTDVIDAILGLR